MKVDERRIVADVARFYDEYDRWPSAASSSSLERSLGVWLNKQRLDHSTGKLDQFRRAVLDQRIPGWDVSAADIWITRAREVSDFILANGRQPAIDATHAGERLVAIWLTTQQALEQSSGLHPARRGWLDGHCPGWRGQKVRLFPGLPPSNNGPHRSPHGPSPM